MNVIAWARVSSREQKEGYSLDAQIRAIREKASKEGWKIIKEFSVAESAKRNAFRAEFEAMLAWARKNAKSEDIRGILCHKLDRACRNMRDAVRLQELEDQLHIRPLFIDNQFGQGAAGQLSFNVMAAVAQYYSDNLRSEVLKGMNEKVEQGWLPANAPYGYLNTTENKDEPIRPDPDRAPTVQRIFELYSRGGMTFESIADALFNEGHTYVQSVRKFHRTALSYILNNRFYIGEILWHGRIFQGKHQPLIARDVFDRCQDILKGKNRRTSKVALPLAGGLIRCKYCGQAITGELIKRKLRGGGVREHVYYRCGNDIRGAEHPNVRWTGEDLEEALIKQLGELQLPSKEITDWFRTALRAALSDEIQFNRHRQTQLRKRQSELKPIRDRLLDAFLTGTVAREDYEKKALEIKTELERIQRDLGSESKVNSEFIDMVEAAFNLSQKAADTWARSNWTVRRELLEMFSLNRELGSSSLELTWNKPFALLANNADLKNGRGGGI